MALRLQFFTLVIRRDRLARCEDRPAFFDELHRDGGILFETDWYDTHLWGETAMNGPDIDEAIHAWEERGLTVKDAEGNWVDLCLCASQRGPLGPCPWLQYDQAQNAVWLEDAEPGPVVGGTTQSRDLEEAMAHHEAAAEAAYTAMYESARPKDDFEDAWLALARAMDVAHFLHKTDDIDRLQARLDHFRGVYDYHIRGFWPLT